MRTSVLRFVVLAICMSKAAITAEDTTTTVPPGVTHTLSFANHGDDPYSKEKKGPNTEITLYPETQNIPLDPAYAHLRPPPPRIPAVFDIFVGLSVFRDGIRCGYTVFTGFKRAAHADRLYFGIVDQVSDGDPRCIDEYCKLAKVEWPNEECKYKSQVRVDERKASDSRGPTLARHYQQKLVGNQEFCLQLDAHSVFTNGWDLGLVEDWKTTQNEMGVLTTYLHDLHNFINPDGSNNPPNHLPHICQTMRGGNTLVRSIGADLILQPKHPQMSALWGAGLSFSKCHAERRVLIDNHNHWVFDGEEFLRASHLWTHGYDLYSPSKVGAVVYHNYTSVPARFEHIQVDQEQKKREEEMGRNRFKFAVKIPFKGLLDGEELDKYPWGTARTLDQYLNFSGVTFEPGKKDTGSCKQLHWVPYSDPSSVEALLPGYTMTPPPTPRPTKRKTPRPTSTISALPIAVNVTQAASAPQANLRTGKKQHRVMNVFAIAVVVVVVFGVVVYTNDPLWRRFRRIFRSKANDAGR
ncbi:hypothetical protein LEN26_014455 [Aphanomyces euteiches]|nr:hypothetical protein LEN26_014455 [Aphanomyces euteiches]KAH9124832.1 hypothetical protein AeMF1_004465 [Aphanomyces euteiches]KAH9187738.1 hypothetical protein AeNC1_010288 [Aphanomyces euteiches]